MKIVKNQTTNVYYVRYNGQIEKAQLSEIGKVKMLCLLELPGKERQYLLVRLHLVGVQWMR